jgi:hypothetical protein
MILKRYFIAFFLSCLSCVITENVSQSKEERKLFIDSMDKIEAKQHDKNGRNLQFLKFDCSNGRFSHFFKISIGIVFGDDYDYNLCTTNLKRSIGHELNSLLLNYGIGKPGEGDDILYVAAVCTKPTSSRRRLRGATYIWKGGGSCQKCSSENYDSRKLEDSNWFKETFSPEIRNSLTIAINETITVKYESCLGNQSTVNIAIQEVPSETKAQVTCH